MELPKFRSEVATAGFEPGRVTVRSPAQAKVSNPLGHRAPFLELSKKPIDIAEHSIEKTEVLSIGAHREELNIKLEGRTRRQNNSFIYLGGAVSSDGRSETEVRRRVQAGANAWRQVE